MTGPIDKDWLMREAASEVDDRNVDLASLPKCPVCGYILYKSTHLRCPECGALFSSEDIYYLETRRELERKARHERWAARIGVLLMLVGGALFAVAQNYAPLSLIWLIVPLVLVSFWSIGQRLFLGEPCTTCSWGSASCGFWRAGSCCSSSSCNSAQSPRMPGQKFGQPLTPINRPLDASNFVRTKFPPRQSNER